MLKLKTLDAFYKIQGGNVNTADQDGWNPLHFAVASGSIGVVEILIANGVNVCDS